MRSFYASLTLLFLIGCLSQVTMKEKRQELIESFKKDEIIQIEALRGVNLYFDDDPYLINLTIYCLKQKSYSLASTAGNELKSARHEHQADKCVISSIRMSLLSLLKHYEPFVRRRSIKLLSVFVNQEVEDRMIKMLNDKNQNVRLASIRTLGEIHSEQSIKALGRIILNPDESLCLRYAVARCLGGIFSPSSVEILKEVAYKKDEDEKLIELTINSLGCLGVFGKEAFSVVWKLIGHQNHEIRMLAMDSFAFMGTRNCRFIKSFHINLLADSVFPEIRRLMFLYYPEMAKALNGRAYLASSIIESAWQDEDPQIRAGAAYAAGCSSFYLKAPEGLLDLLNDPKPYVRSRAIKAIEAIGNHDDAVYIQPLRCDDDVFVRETAEAFFRSLN